jgi:hypothetical protein
MSNRQSKPKVYKTKLSFIIKYVKFSAYSGEYEYRINAYSANQAQFLFYKYFSPSYHRVKTIIEANAVSVIWKEEWYVYSI